LRIGRPAEDHPPRRDEELRWAASSNERLSGDDYSELLANQIAKGENPVMLSLPALATSRILRRLPLTAAQSYQRRRDLPPLEVA
jgi:hypothetical protein